MAYKRKSPQPVIEGGTGLTSATAYAVICGGTTSTAALQSIASVGTAGQILTSNGAALLPTFQAAASSGITTINGDTGSVTGATVSIKGNGASGAGKTVVFSGAGTAMSLGITDASANTFVGINTGNALAGGVNNTQFGGYGLNVLTSGSYNTGIAAALASLTTGTNNISIGQGSAVSITTGHYNIAIGRDVGGLWVTSSSSNIALNHPGVNGDLNVLRIGASTGAASQGLAKAYICGIDGVNVGSVAKVVTMASDQLGTATITAGAGIAVTPGANTITIAAIGAGVSWSVIAANQTATVNNGYICNKAGTLAILLPATAAIGDLIEVTGINTATGIQITQNANQQIFFGTGSTTVGIAGTLTSTAIRDSLKMVCVVAGASTVWNVVSGIGNWTIV